MTALLIVSLTLMAALGSLMHWMGCECLAIAFASYGGRAIGYFALGASLLGGVAAIAFGGVLIAFVLLFYQD